MNQDEYEKEGVGDFVLWKKWVDGRWRRRLGFALGQGPARLAHRVFRAEHGASRPADRHPRRRHRPPLSASRKRNRAERSGDRPALRAATGSTSSTCSSTARRCRSRSGTCTPSATCSQRGYTGRELRYALLSGANYAKNLNFTWQGMDDAKTALARIDEWRKRISGAAPALTPPVRADGAVCRSSLNFVEAIDERPGARPEYQRRARPSLPAHSRDE